MVDREINRGRGSETQEWRRGRGKGESGGMGVEHSQEGAVMKAESAVDCWEGAEVKAESIVDSRSKERAGGSGVSLERVSRPERQGREKGVGMGSGLPVIGAGSHGVEAVEKRRA